MNPRYTTLKRALFTSIHCFDTSKIMDLLQKKWNISKALFLPLLLAILSFVVYANTLQGDFVWDDRALFVEHHDLWQWKNLKKLLASQDNLFGDRYTGYYRPFPNLTFLLDRYLWGQAPSGYHLINIIFHVLTTLSVYWMACIVFQNRAVAFLGALLFAWHPVHTEDVAWINGRNNVISSFFFILSFIFYLRYARNERFRRTCYAFSLIFFAISLFSKEYALTLPFIIACYEYVAREASMKDRLFRIVKKTAPYIIVILSYVAIRSAVLPAHGIKFMHWETFWMRLLTVPKTFGVYLRLLVLPLNLTVHYETTLISSVSDPVFWVTSAIAACYGGMLYYTYSCSKSSFLMLAWIILTLTPVLNIIPLSDDATFIAERYLYLPSAGFCIIAAQLLANYWYARRGSRQKLAFGLPVLLGCLLLQWYAFGTLNRNLAWQNELALWTDTTSQSPRSYKPYFNLAAAYRKAEKYDAALEMFEKAYWMASGDEDRGLILCNIGYVYYTKKDYDRAKATLEEAVLLSPTNAGIYNLLGNVYFEGHDLEKALEQYEKSIEIDPKIKDTLINIGMTYFKMGKTDQTIEYLERVRSTMPEDGKLCYYLGSAYDKKGIYDRAAACYAIYLKSLPCDAHYQEVIRRLKQIEAAP